MGLGKKIIAICQSGGAFKTNEDGSLSYRGGDAHAIEIDDQMKLSEFKNEIKDMYNFFSNTMSIKYFLPGNNKTLITVSNNKDLTRLIQFHEDSVTTNIYISTEEIATPEISNIPTSRSSRLTLSEIAVLEDPPTGSVDDAMNPDIHLSFPLDEMDDTTNLDDHIDIPIEISSLPPAISIDYKHVKSAQQWQNTITGIGQRFNSVHVFREALRKYAVANQFSYRYKKNDSNRVTVKCKEEGCPWRIHASRLVTTQLFCIKKMTSTHTCERAAVMAGYQATRSWVASIVKEKLKAFPNYKPKDIVIDIKQEFGIELNYFQAWRGKEIAREQLQGSYKQAYKNLPLFCEKIVETNPGSFATFTTKDDSSFHQLFVAFHSSLYGFREACRPLLFLDSLRLKSKYQETLLTATAADGNDGVFPVAFAMVDEETDENWRWFLFQLKSALPESGNITFVADNEKGLKESIPQVCGSEFHAYCLHYLTEQLVRDMKGQFTNDVERIILDDFLAAAYEPRLEGFKRNLESIKGVSLDAYNWVLQNDPSNWANALFRGMRYNHMMSSFGDFFYGWVSDAHDFPITQMVDVIRGKISDLIYERRMESDQWLMRLTPSMEEKLEKERLKVRSLQVLLSTGSTFEIHGDSIDIVDIDHWECSCKVWQLTGLPCCHAIAVFSCIGQSPYDYCSRYFTTENYRGTYSESVYHILNVDLPFQDDSSKSIVTVMPPPARRPPGRPSRKKLGPHEFVKRQLQCSKCKGVGHNRSTCKQHL